MIETSITAGVTAGVSAAINTSFDTVVSALGVTAWGRNLTTQEKQNFKAFCAMLSRAEGLSSDDPRVIAATGGNIWLVRQGYKSIEKYNRSHPEGCSATGKAIGPFQIEGTTWCDFTKGNLSHCRENLNPECQMSVFVQILKSAKTYHTCAKVTRNGKKVRVCNKVRSTAVSAYDDVLAGRFIDAMKKLNGRYSSMPESSSPTKDPLLAGGYAPKVKYIVSMGGKNVPGILS